METGVGVGVLDGMGAWKSSSRPGEDGLGEAGGNGEAGKVNDGTDGDEGGGNSSRICGSGRRC